MKIGVHLPTAPRMLREAVLGYLAGQADFEVVLMPHVQRPPAEAIAGRGLEALITESAGPPPSQAVGELLHTLPRLRIVFIDPSGRDATLARMAPTFRRLTDISADSLAAALRSEADRPPHGAASPGRP